LTFEGLPELKAADILDWHPVEVRAMYFGFQYCESVPPAPNSESCGVNLTIASRRTQNSVARSIMAAAFGKPVIPQPR